MFGKINLRVRDLDAAVEYTRDVLGGEILRESHTTAFGKIAIVKVASLMMEIIQPDPASPLAQNIERRGEGIDSVGFFTDDVASLGIQLEEREARVVKPEGDLAGTVWLHPKNPLSMSIEFYARGPGSE